MLERETPTPNSEIHRETRQIVASLTERIAAIGIAQEISVLPSMSRKGTQMITLSGAKELRMEATVVASALETSYADFIRLLSKTYSGSEQPVDAIKLLSDEIFASSCVTLASINPETAQGNRALNTLTGRQDEMIPTYYGSTDGLNFAEVLETIVCANELRQRGLSSYVLFDTSGHQSIRAQKNLEDSIAILPSGDREDFYEFIAQLGRDTQEQRLSASRLLCPDENIVFVQTEDVFDAVSNHISLGRVALLAKLSGGDPKIVDGFNVSQVLSQMQSGDPLFNPSIPIQRVGTPNGFSMYAREVVIAKDFPGLVAYPFKLTTHANVYKILGRYESLLFQRGSSGAILCPIQRQRIQTREQATAGTDPCDVLVIAYLAQKFPKHYMQLLTEFKAASVVLTPETAAFFGTADNRFVIQNYFPI